MEKRGRKKKASRDQENEAFIRATYHHFEVMKKKLEQTKEDTKEYMKREMKALKIGIPSNILNTKLKDLPEQTNINRTNQREEQKYTRDVSQERSINSENRPSAEVLPPRRVLQVAAESRMFKTPSCNSTKKGIGTPMGQTPAGILRIPEPGEYAVSATGSPLLVSGSSTDTVNINIPLKNGKKIAILSNADVIPDSISNNLDPDVRLQLKQLTNTLSMIIEDSYFK